MSYRLSNKQKKKQKNKGDINDAQKKESICLLVSNPWKKENKFRDV